MSTDGKVTPELVDAYLAYGRTEAEEHFWAFDAVVDLVQASPREGLTLVRELLSRPLEPDLLFYVAAGPLEDLLACHGREVVDEVLDLARRDPQARKALLQLTRDMAAGKPAQAEPSTADQSVFFDRLHHVDRAGRLESAHRR